MKPVQELNKIAKELGDFNDKPKACEKIANEILDVSDELEGAEKKASLIVAGDRMVCCNPTQGLFKGRIYVAGLPIDPKPNFIEVMEESGDKVGIFDVNRFLPDWKAY